MERSTMNGFVNYQYQGQPVTKEEFLLLMERSGLNQKQFANTLGISPALISKIKKGEKPISKELNFRLLELKDELKINS